MKKLLLVLCAMAFTFMSCSSDDDNGTQDPVQDPLIGVWKYDKLLLNGVESPLSECKKQEIFNCNANGTYTYTEYRSENDNCVLSEVVPGVWSNIGNNTYEFTEELNSYDYTMTLEGNTFSYNINTNYGTGAVTETYVYVRQ